MPPCNKGHSNPASLAEWAEGVNTTIGALANIMPDFFFGASEDAATLAYQVTQRGGTAGIFVIGADLADDHHTPHFDFDESALAKSVLLCGGVIASAMQLRLDQS